ncbi:VOC family protein [Streptomyces sp. NPDC046860]|uniref:VOC family protein n=1 Tax=Streptomyces sp. NPDC046860 TaxID=3154495 RepID=UPI00340E9CAF
MLTTRFPYGAPNWIDLGSPDLDASLAFYSSLFGWRPEPAGPEAGGYVLLRLDGRTAAGAMALDPDRGRAGWTVYFRCADALGTAEAAGVAHGTVVFQPTEVRGLARVAGLKDPAGAAFRVWQPDPVEGLEAATEPGALCWVELHTPDVAASAAFYHRVLGVETSGVSFPGGTYTSLYPAGAGEDAMFGGVVTTLDDPADTGRPPQWLPYFGAADTDALVARATELGGSVRMPATSVPGVGRLARVADPHGYEFALIKGDPAQEA